MGIEISYSLKEADFRLMSETGVSYELAYVPLPTPLQSFRIASTYDHVWDRRYVIGTINLRSRSDLVISDGLRDSILEHLTERLKARIAQGRLGKKFEIGIKKPGEGELRPTYIEIRDPTQSVVGRITLRDLEGLSIRFEGDEDVSTARRVKMMDAQTRLTAVALEEVISVLSTKFAKIFPMLREMEDAKILDGEVRLNVENVKKAIAMSVHRDSYNSIITPELRPSMSEWEKPMAEAVVRYNQRIDGELGVRDRMVGRVGYAMHMLEESFKASVRAEGEKNGLRKLELMEESSYNYNEAKRNVHEAMAVFAESGKDIDKKFHEALVRLGTELDSGRTVNNETYRFAIRIMLELKDKSPPEPKKKGKVAA